MGALDPPNVNTRGPGGSAKETVGARPPDVSAGEHSEKKLHEHRASVIIRLFYAFLKSEMT